MSTETIVIATLLLLISTISTGVIIYWHTSTRGSWKQWPAGRSLMALLTIISLGHGWGGANRLLGDYALKQPILGVLYLCFAVALLIIGITIHKELARGEAKLLHPSHGPTTGSVAAVILATTTTTTTTTEESTDGNP